MIRYLESEMGINERRLFEKEVLAEQSLSRLKNLMEEIDDAIADDQLFDLVTKLKETQELYNVVIGATYVVSKEKHYSRVSWKHIAAAGITLVLIVSTVVFNFSRPANHRIFASYYGQYEGGMVGSRSSGEMNPMSNAVQLYNTGKFSAALAQFGKILGTDGTNTAAHYFSGLSLMELKNYNEAIQNLSYVVLKKDIAYANDARWYLALCYLETNQTRQSVTILNELVDNNNIYKIRVLDLLKKIQ